MALRGSAVVLGFAGLLFAVWGTLVPVKAYNWGDPCGPPLIQAYKPHPDDDGAQVSCQQRAAERLYIGVSSAAVVWFVALGLGSVDVARRRAAAQSGLRDAVLVGALLLGLIAWFFYAACLTRFVVC